MEEAESAPAKTHSDSVLGERHQEQSQFYTSVKTLQAQR